MSLVKQNDAVLHNIITCTYFIAENNTKDLDTKPYKTPCWGFWSGQSDITE